jgi:hypothetical protein
MSTITTSPITPESVIAMFVSGLIRAQRFEVSVQESDGDYNINIETMSMNQGRVLGAGRQHLNDLILIANRISNDISITLLDPNEAVGQAVITCKDPLIAIQSFLDLIDAPDVQVVKLDDGKAQIIDQDGLVPIKVRDAIQRLAFDIARTHRSRCEISWA